MKLTHGKIIPAFRALLALSPQALPLPLAWSLHKAKTALQPHVDFYCAEEQKAIAQCGGQVDPAGKITFETQDQAAAFARLSDALNTLEADVDLTPIPLRPDTLDAVQITVNDLAALSCLTEGGE